MTRGGFAREGGTDYGGAEGDSSGHSAMTWPLPAPATGSWWGFVTDSGGHRLAGEVLPGYTPAHQ